MENQMAPLIVTFLLSAVVLWIVLYELAKKRILFCFPREGEITFLMDGENLADMFANVSGHVLGSDGKIREITPVGNPANTEKSGKIKQPLNDHTLRDNSRNLPRKLLWNQFGLYFVGPIPGTHSVHSFKIKKNRLQDKAKDGQSLKEQWIEYGETVEVTSLRWRFPRPIYVEGADLPGDGSTVNLVLEAVFQVVSPEKSVFGLRGDFMGVLEQGVSQETINRLKTMKVKITENIEGVAKEKEEFLTYRTFLQLDLSKELASAVLGINEDKDGRPGLETLTGIRLVALYIPAWEPGPQTAELAKSQEQAEIAKAKAKAAVLTAQGIADSAVIQAKADAQVVALVAAKEAERASIFIKALTDNNVSPDEAAKQIGAMLEAEKLNQTPNLQTLIQRGSANVKLGS